MGVVVFTVSTTLTLPLTQKVTASADRMKCTVTLNKITDFSMQVHNSAKCKPKFETWQKRWNVTYYIFKHLPEKASGHVCSLPPYLLPCTEEPGHSFPEYSKRQSDRLTRFESKQHNYHGNNSFMWGFCFHTCLVVQGRNVKCSVPWGILRSGVCPIKQQMLQVLGEAMLARLSTSREWKNYPQIVRDNLKWRGRFHTGLFEYNRKLERMKRYCRADSERKKAK